MLTFWWSWGGIVVVAGKLTHCLRVTEYLNHPISIGEGYGLYLQTSSYYLNQCWPNINGLPRHTLQYILVEISLILIINLHLKPSINEALDSGVLIMGTIILDSERRWEIKYFNEKRPKMYTLSHHNPYGNYVEKYIKLCIIMCQCIQYHTGGLVQDCSISSALAMEILQSCTKLSICCGKRDKLLTRVTVIYPAGVWNTIWGSQQCIKLLMLWVR